MALYRTLSTALLRVDITTLEPHGSLMVLPTLSALQVRYKKKRQKFKLAPVTRERSSRFTKKLMKPFELIEKISTEEYWDNTPNDDVWIRANYPIQKHGISQAIHNHQLYAQPTMFNQLDSVLFADLSYNMATAKKTKFLKPLKETILLPHRFVMGDTNKCIVFCQSSDDIACALECGAVHAGADKLINMVDDNTITKEDYDFVLATPDMVLKLSPLRSKLRDLYPNQKNGSISADVASMVTYFTHGVTIESQPTTSEDVNRLQLPLGQLSMSPDQLITNFQLYLQTLAERRSAKASGAMILQASLIAPPSPERFFLLESSFKTTKPSRSKRSIKEVDEDEEVDSRDVAQG